MFYQARSVRQRAYSFDFTDETAVLWNETDIADEAQSNGFVLRDQSIANRLNQSLPAIYADLIDIAASVHFADRKALRGPANHGFARNLNLVVPVRCLDQWLSAPMRDALFSVLNFMTQDRWNLDFRQKVTPGRGSETQDNLAICDAESACEVGLYSGGLDSFAGLAEVLSKRQDTRFLCVSVTGNFRHRQRQHEQLLMLQRTFRAKVTHIPVDYWLLNAEKGRQEQTRRTRGFLFLLIGGVTALMTGQTKLSIYENGIGAINLPFDGSQVGIDNSRSVNPITLRLVSRLLSLAGGRDFSIVNHCLFQTKAEMCGKSAVASVLAGIRSTFSCDGFPVRRRQFAQCGFCTSCLLRRQSLESTSLSEHDSGDYGCDLMSGELWSGQHLRALRSMNIQALRVEEALECAEPWKNLTLAFPELRRVAEAISVGNDSLEVRQNLLRLYGQQVIEWRSFSALKHLQLQAVACAA
jgi:7-cyano-7-deazaguanine synthase in queuosine biosynthesis